MPRPRPLTGIVSARSSPADNHLTPRTPHSRPSRVEENYTDIELEQVRDYDQDHEEAGQLEQTAPLFSSSASDTFPLSRYRSRGDEASGNSRGRFLNTIFSWLPLIAGVLLAGFLLVLVFISSKSPDILLRYFGVSVTNETSPIPFDSTESNLTTPSPSHDGLSYENYTKFPLLPSEYLAECYKLHAGYMSHGDYWEPHRMGVLDVHHDDQLAESQPPTVCTSTITYMLDGEVGLLADLALMAQAAALARERNRTFLVDDTYWNRGKWTDHFQDVRARQPGPERGCKAPPPEELVACPRLARHWVINSRTAKFHFGHEFSNHYENPYAHQLNRLKPMFNAALDSFRETIRPNVENAALIHTARAELAQVALPGNSEFQSYIAVHIRRGDRKPSSFRFHGNYVPTADFASAVDDTWTRLHPDRSGGEHPVVYVASDAPSVVLEFSNLLNSRYRTFSLSQSQNPLLRALASPAEYRQKDFDKLERSVRIRATKGMVVDFALTSGMWSWNEDILPDAVVCTISSNVCKLSAIGLGWDVAFGAVDEMGNMEDTQKRWVEVDQKGQVVPVWNPFELFP